MRLLPPGEWHGDERGPGAERTFQAPQPELGGAALRRSRGALARQHDAALPVIAQGHGQPDHVSVCAAGVGAADIRASTTKAATALPAPSAASYGVCTTGAPA